MSAGIADRLGRLLFLARTLAIVTAAPDGLALSLPAHRQEPGAAFFLNQIWIAQDEGSSSRMRSARNDRGIAG
jgi:hypothetical protein